MQNLTCSHFLHCSQATPSLTWFIVMPFFQTLLLALFSPSQSRSHSDSAKTKERAFSARNPPMASISLQAKLQSFQLACSPSLSDFLSYNFPLLASSVPASEYFYQLFLLPGMLFSQISTRLILSFPI